MSQQLHPLGGWRREERGREGKREGKGEEGEGGGKGDEGEGGGKREGEESVHWEPGGEVNLLGSGAQSLNHSLTGNMT